MKTVNRCRIVLGIACALALGACVEPSDGTPAPADLADFDVDPSVEVRVDEAGFEPASLELEANVTVAVTNAGDEPRRLRQVDTPANRRIATGTMQPGETVAVHLADEGTVELEDLDSGEIVTLDVTPAAPAAD